MNRSTKLVITLMYTGCIIFLCWLMYMYFSGNFSLMRNNQRLSKEPNQAILYYLRGENHILFVHGYINPFKSDERTEKEWVEHNKLAEEDYSKTIELIPDCAVAYLARLRCRGYWWYWYRKPEDNLAEIADLKNAIELAPTSIQARISLAYAYSNGGHSEQAKEECQKILAIDPDDVRIQDRVKDTLIRIERQEKAGN